MPHVEKRLHDFISLIDPSDNQIFNMTDEEAEERIACGDPQNVREIDGSFAFVHK
jgi:asparagine synthase (glutamine-hydrolysing)